MQIKRSELTKTKYKLSISSDQATLDNIKTHVLRRLATNQVKLPGFRAGKAPLSLVEKNIDQNLLQSEFLDEAVNRMYTQAIKAEKISIRSGTLSFNHTTTSLEFIFLPPIEKVFFFYF